MPTRRVPQVTQNLPPMASGYSTFRQIISSDMILKSTLAVYRQQSIAKDITSSNNVPSGTIQPNTIFEFSLPIKVRLHRGYEKSQRLEVQHVDRNVVQMNITRSNYCALRFDYIDTQDPEFPKFMVDFRNAVSEAFSEEVDRTILTELVEHVDPCNQGIRAGKISGQINLGTAGAPLTLTKDNILTFLSMLDSVFGEQNIPGGERYIVFPRVASSLFLNNSLLLDPNLASSKNMLQYAKVALPLFNLTIYFTNHLPARIDPKTGDQVYVLLAGTKDATGLVEAINKQVVVDQETQIDTFNSGIKNLFVWDFLPIRPDSLAAAYVKIVIPQI